DIREDRYLYNRCHLIGDQLTGQNANEKNLITGTRRMNVDGMEPFESRVARYIRRTGGRVLYRVTPVFDGDDLVARGVLMEALSVEDGGEGICLNVFIYNTQPGVVIDYATGESWRE
ncbi:MAG: DNA/RNA non-specific endonuclease, partial [Firmicutes bacterium]|nr:DNA/RNA non-specific endonuclease [Bacillota bacterium]